MPRPIAAIDVGSNTVHMVVLRLRKDRPPKHLYSESELLELGREVMLHGRITEDKASQLTDTLLGFVRSAHKLGAREVLIAATGAFRQASNGADLAKELSRKLEVPVRIITSRREAELSFFGVSSKLRPHQHQLVIDSGGASTELVLSKGKDPIAFASLPVGASLLASQLKNDPPLPLEWARLTVNIAETLSRAPQDVKPSRAVAMGGAAHRFEEILEEKRANKSLRLQDLEWVTQQLLRYPSKRIAKVTGLQPRRVALLAASSLILSVVLAHYGLRKVKVVHLGLRDGMALAWAAKGATWWRGGRIKRINKPRRKAPPRSSRARSSRA